MQLRFWRWKRRGTENSADAIATSLPEFCITERKLMLEVAHDSIFRAVRRDGEMEAGPARIFSGKLSEPRACFVSLFKNTVLRGCVGNLQSAVPLCEAVARNASAAALRDPRFDPVTSIEVPEITVEISVLSTFRPLRFSSPDDLLAQLQPHRHGVLLQVQDRVATFLPQVWEQIPEKRDFLARLGEKAGCFPGIWKTSQACISVYEAETFEDEPGILESN